MRRYRNDLLVTVCVLVVVVSIIVLSAWQHDKKTHYVLESETKQVIIPVNPPKQVGKYYIVIDSASGRLLSLSCTRWHITTR